MRTTHGRRRAASLAAIFCLLLAAVALVGCEKEKPAQQPGQEEAKDPSARTSPTSEEDSPGPASDTVAVPAPRQPKIRFDRPDHDFGEVEAGDEVAHVFSFRNEGNAPLTVGKVLTSCGCTAALVSEQEIPPEGTGEIKVTFQAKGLQGAVKKGLTVESNDPEDPLVRLTIGGNVLSEVRVEPRYLDWRTLRPGNTPPPKKLTIRFLRGRGLRLERIQSESPSVVLTKTSEEENKLVYSVALAEDLPTGRFTGRITIRSNSERVPEVHVPFQGQVQGNVKVVPHILSLGRIEPGKPLIRHLRVSKTADRDFTVQKVKATSGAIATEIHEEKEGTRFRIKVTYNPANEAGGRIAERITILVNDGQDGFLEVPVYGTMEEVAEKPVG